MNRIIIVFMILILWFTPRVYAENNAGKKFYRGMVNIVTAPVEIPKQARAYWIEGAQKTDHILVWIGCGTVWGMVQTIKRTGSGLWDIISFPLEKPNDYDPLLMPEFVFEQWPSDPDVFIFKKKD